MDSIEERVDALLADARRAATPGALGEDPGHPGALLTSPSDLSRRAMIPNASPLSVAIDGAGLFVLATPDNRTLYGRLGDFRVKDGTLVDGQGRRVLGFPPPHDGHGVHELGALVSIRVGGAKDVSIAADGTVSATVGHDRQTLGCIALAIFAAPERLSRDGETTAGASPAAGLPHIVKPGQANVGALRDHVLENSTVALEADLVRAWRLGQQGHALTALAHACDECERDALELVR